MDGDVQPSPAGSGVAKCLPSNTPPPSDLLCWKRASSQDFFCSQESGGRTATPETAVVGDDTLPVPHSAEMHQDTWPRPPPPTSLCSLHEILHFTASRQTPPTPWDLPTPANAAMGRETSAFATPGLQSIRCGHGRWSSLDSGRQQDRSRGTSAALKQPTQIYCTTTNHHGSTRRDQDSRERSRIREPTQTRGVPPQPTTHAPTEPPRSSVVWCRGVPRRPVLVPLGGPHRRVGPGGRPFPELLTPLSHGDIGRRSSAALLMLRRGAWRHSTSSTLRAKREAVQASTLC